MHLAAALLSLPGAASALRRHARRFSAVAIRLVDPDLPPPLNPTAGLGGAGGGGGGGAVSPVGALAVGDLAGLLLNMRAKTTKRNLHISL